MTSDKLFTIDRVKAAFERRLSVMTAPIKEYPEAEAFVSECLDVAAQYIQKIGGPVAGVIGQGIALTDRLSVVMTIRGGQKQPIYVDVQQTNGPGAIELLKPRDIVHRYGANQFAQLICEALDRISDQVDNIVRQNEMISEHVIKRLALTKAKITGPTN
jgi:hypothetical protein